MTSLMDLEIKKTYQKFFLRDVIVIPEMEAFSIATANNFSGITPPSIIDLEDTPETQGSLP